MVKFGFTDHALIVPLKTSRLTAQELFREFNTNLFTQIPTFHNISRPVSIHLLIEFFFKTSSVATQNFV